MNRPAPTAPIEYPSSDGKPMAEDDWQRNTMLYGIGALRRHFRARSDVYVSGDLLIYYEEGNPRKRVAPDIFVVIGVEKRARQNYLLWEEGRAPAFVLEVASENSWRDALTWKRELYARIGVQEYWQFDPRGEYLPSRLQGESLAAAGYESQPVATDPDGALTLRSVTLDLELRAAPGQEMCFRTPATGGYLLSHDEEADARLAAEKGLREAEAARLAAEAGRRFEAERRRAAEARVAELEALLRLRGGSSR